MRARLPTLSLAALLTGLLVLVGPAACNVVAGLDKLRFAPDDAGPLCSSADGCDDANPCTDDSCSPDGVCAHAAVDDGPSAVQFPGDCKAIQCSAGQPSEEDDPGDAEDDKNPCTAEACEKGATTHTPEPDETACLLNQAKGACEGGACVVECGPGKPPCDDKAPCTTDTCDEALGKCSFVALMDGLPNPDIADVVGDCKAAVCVGGAPALVDDDQDTPSFPGDCQEGQCAGGQPSAKLYLVDTPCVSDGGKFCDGNGACVACNEGAQCGVTDQCQMNLCNAHVCQQNFTPVHTAVAEQVAGDCQAKVCDGAGAVVSEADDGDAKGDGNPCTDDVCVGGALTHPNSPAGTVCGAGLVCNGMGACVGCVDNGQCTAPETCGGCGVAEVCCCQPKTCASLGLHCGAAPDGCGGVLMCDDGKNAGETDVDCGGPICSVKCAQGKTCAVNADCAGGACVDGVCCAGACAGQCKACNVPGSLGVCTNLPSGQVDNAANVLCNGANACDGAGGCKKVLGQLCVMGSDCLSGFCADGVCCNQLCSGVCMSCSSALKGAGMDGICGPSQAGTNPGGDCNAPAVCDGMGACQ